MKNNRKNYLHVLDERCGQAVRLETVFLDHVRRGRRCWVDVVRVRVNPDEICSLPGGGERRRRRWRLRIISGDCVAYRTRSKAFSEHFRGGAREGEENPPGQNNGFLGKRQNPARVHVRNTDSNIYRIINLCREKKWKTRLIILPSTCTASV